MSFFAFVITIHLVSLGNGHQEPSGPSTETLVSEMKRASKYYRSHVARHGGYVYYTSTDLTRRLGEGVASNDQIWVQPPGTPTVGIAYLVAYRATGDGFYLNAMTETAEALIYGQLESGGWTNCIDFDPSGERTGRYRNGRGKPKGRNFSSLDDDQTQAALRFLMRADRVHEFRHEAIHESVTIALDALIAAQFPNGGFPQGWDESLPEDPPIVVASYPDYDWRTEGRIKNYWDMYTLNDGLAGTVASTLILAERTYDDPRYREALTRLGDFLISAQLPEPQPAWAQQYSYQMRPIWARRFEPAAITGRESQDVLQTLLTIAEFTGDVKYLEPVPRALDYLEQSRLPDGRLARFYELKTNRPLYMERREGEYLLTYDDDRLPNHYGWTTGSRLDSIRARYQAIRNGRNPTDPSPSIARLAGRAAEILDTLDEQGRWISTFDDQVLVGDPRFRPGDCYLSSAVFAKNLRVLSEYLNALKRNDSADEGVSAEDRLD